MSLIMTLLLAFVPLPCLGQSNYPNIQSAALPDTNTVLYSPGNNLRFNVPSGLAPLPCQAYVLREQTNYICALGRVWCLPGWKNPKNYCRDPDCPDCDLERGECTGPNICTCKVGYFGDSCKNCLLLPGCYQGYCNRAFECICRPGWDGPLCNKAICREGCSPETGSCDVPNECRCSSGWRGENCTECLTLSGCAHGTCNRPLECNCNTGWKGTFCEQPICHPNCISPYGRCLRPNFCLCELGYTGQNCEECRTYPGCLHGTCAPSDDGGMRPWTCQCQEGWRGVLCDIPVADPSIAGGAKKASTQHLQSSLPEPKSKN